MFNSYTETDCCTDVSINAQVIFCQNRTVTIVVRSSEIDIMGFSYDAMHKVS